MADHSFTFHVRGVELSRDQQRAVSDAIAGAAAGALLHVGVPAPKSGGVKWGVEGIAGGIWAALEHGGAALGPHTVQINVENRH